MKHEKNQETFALAELTYCDRQLIVITDDAAARSARETGRKLALEAQGVNWTRLAQAAISEIVPLGGLVAEVSREAFKAWGRARDNGIKVLPIGKSDATEIVFPPGHPREGLLYIGHPAIPRVYYCTADFHRVTFEHKFSEAIDLLMSLGATKIKVEHIRGWAKDFSAKISVPLPEPTAKASAQVQSRESSGSKLLYSATLTGSSTPTIPDDLVWFPHEPTWKSVAKGRVSYGLKNFSLTVSYEDDFGINAGLKIAAAKSGLELGGKFEDHEATTWKIEGTFK